MKSPQLFLAAIAITVTFACESSPTYKRDTSAVKSGIERHRLPNSTVPRHYDIRLIPYMGNDIFNGEVNIDVEVTERTSTITLHQEQLEIDRDTLTVTSQNGTHAISNITYDQNLHFYSLIFPTALLPGNYSIHIEYAGKLMNNLKGFYKDYYNTSSGEIRWFVSTFFAPIYARQAFPCFDEPGLKAQFTISVAHWQNQVALSNSPNVSISEPNSTIGNRVWTNFQTTPLMSTYLVAFMVSDFEYVSNADGSFKIWSRPEALISASYSLSGISLLNELGRFTGINYNSSFPKMDQVALPNNAPSAMENWGLITYRENLLLWYDGVSTTRNKQNIETVVAHEFTHQWFGNRVTHAWWKYVWLSEGFATFFEYYVPAQVNPTWRLMEQFTVDVYHFAMLSDSLDTSRPMNGDAETPSEIYGIYDVISYQKGASVLRMLMNFVGEPVFERGLQIYQANNSYKTGTPDDVWDAMKEANEILSSTHLIPHVDIKTVMDTWTNQKGYPVVTVIRNYTTNTQVLSQERFLLKGRGSSNDTTEYRWWIPLNFATQSTLNFTYTGANGWIRSQDESVMISGVQSTDWVIFNVEQTGYYRVNYDVNNWNMIIEYLQSSNFVNIPPVTRAQLIDDAFNLARAGYLEYSIPLSLIRYLRQETDYIPWAAAFNAIKHLNRMLVRSTGYTNFQDYIFSRVSPIHNSLGYAVQDSDQHVTSFLRSESHNWACRMRCPGCNGRVQRFMQDFYSSGGSSVIPVDLRAWAYCEGLRNAAVEVWNFMFERYLLTDVDGEKVTIISGLGCSLNPTILNRYLSLSITENSGIRSQDRPSVFTSVFSSSPSNVDVALEFLRNNIDGVAAHYGGLSAVGSLLESLATNLVSESQLTSLEALISEHSNHLGETASAAQRAVETVKENIAWLSIHESSITQWISEEMNSSGNSLASASLVLLFSVYAIAYLIG